MRQTMEENGYEEAKRGMEDNTCSDRDYVYGVRKAKEEAEIQRNWGPADDYWVAEFTIAMIAAPVVALIASIRSILAIRNNDLSKAGTQATFALISSIVLTVFSIAAVIVDDGDLSGFTIAYLIFSIIFFPLSICLKVRLKKSRA